MHISRKMGTITVIVFALVAIGLISFYTYTHQPIDHIPSDSTSSKKITFYALGDQGTGGIEQWSVAHAMEKRAEAQRDLDFVVLLGDNFYTKNTLTVDSPEWKSKFEHVYSGVFLDATPFYAVLGNHDHGRADGATDEANPSHRKHVKALQNSEVQLEYASKHLGSNRWRMPDHYYSADFGQAQGQTLLRIVFLDTNLPQEDLLKEADFIREQFSKTASKAIWKIVVGHHPIRTYGKHFGETQDIEEAILPALKDARIDMYLSGHDHNQQVIAREGEPFYVVSGGGGAHVYSMRKPSPDLRFAKSANGFVGVKVDSSHLDLSIYDTSGIAISSYRIDRNCDYGKANCLQSVP